MNEMLLSLLLLALPIGLCFAVGLLPTALLLPRRLWPERWLYCPFLGAALLVIGLQNLVYLRLPLAHTTWPFVVTVFALGIAGWLLRSRREGCPQANVGTTLVVALVVFLFNAAGALRLGTQAYVGGAWIDHFNYVSIAELLVHHPIDVDPATGLGPHLSEGLLKRWDRIGQSVIHGAVAVLSGENTRTAFGPTMLLASFLLPIAARLLGTASGLSSRAALVFAGAAGTSAVLVLLHLECFLSHYLSVPFLVLWACLLADEKLDWRSAPVLALVAGFVWLCYTEFSLLVLGMTGAACAAAAVFQGRAAVRYVSGLLLGGAGALALAPAFLPLSASILRRTGGPVSALDHVYPWANSIDGLVTAWFGLDRHVLPEVLGKVLPAVAVGLTVCAVAGLAYRLRDARYRTGTLVLFALLSLLPYLALQPESHGYQLFKLLTTFHFALLLGLLCGVQELFARVRSWALRIPAGAAIALLIAANCAVADAQIRRCSSAEWAPRANGFLLLSPGNRALFDELEGTSGQKLAIACEHPLLNAWLCYHARRHDVVVTFPTISDMSIAGTAQADRLAQDRQRLDGRRVIVAPEWSLVDPFSVRTGMLIEWQNPNGSDAGHLWLGNEAAFTILGSHDTRVVFDAEVSRGPSRAEPERELRIAPDVEGASPVSITFDRRRRWVTELPAAGGQKRYRVTVPQTATVVPAAPGDPRTLLVRLDNLKVYPADIVSSSWTPQGSVELTRGIGRGGQLAGNPCSLVLRRADGPVGPLRLSFDNLGAPTAIAIRTAQTVLGPYSLLSGRSSLEMDLPQTASRVFSIEIATVHGWGDVRLLEATTAPR